MRNYKYYDLILGAYVCVLLCANLIGPAKLSTVQLPLVGQVTFLAGVLFFPISYFFGDVLTEVYGYARDRRVVWAGFGALLFASLIAFWCGSFVNSFVLAKMKIVTSGRWLWTRAIGSTVCGECVDSGLFYSIAFAGLWAPRLLIDTMLTQYVLKVSWEVLATPLTYRMVGFLKRAEQEDYYDRDTNFTPFSLEVPGRGARAAAEARQARTA